MAMQLSAFISVVSLAISDAHSGHIDQAFAEWRSKHQKEYTSEAEAAQRRDIFAKTLDEIAQEARENPHAQFEAGPWADLTEDEFRSLVEKPKPSERAPTLPRFVPDPSMFLNETIDWVDRAVTEVKNQGKYNTCWSFATSGTMEGQMFVVGGRKPETLANQMLVDCCDKCYGHPDVSLNWLLNIGQETQASYGPYKGPKGTCKKDPAHPREEIVSVQVVKPESACMAALQHGPYHVAVDPASTRNYKGGILTNTICKSPGGHDVLLVGAGEENGLKYWKIKNSYGTKFGESGYWRMERGKAAMCLGKKNSWGSEATTAVGKPPAISI